MNAIICLTFTWNLSFSWQWKILLWYTLKNNNEFSRLLHIFTTVFLIYSYSRFRRSHSDPDQNFLSTDSHSGYPRFVSSPYAHPFFKQDFRDRSYDMTQFPRNHSYPQTPSASSPPHVTIKQEPKDQGFETSGKFQIKSVKFFRNINIEKKTSEKNKQTKTGGFDVNCALSLILIDKSQYQHLQTGLFSFLAVDRFPACSGFTRPDIARHGSPQEGTYLY